MYNTFELKSIQNMVALSYKHKGKIVKIHSTCFHDVESQHKIANIGLVPGAIIKVLDYNKSNHVLHLQVCNVEYVLRDEDCNLIYVEVV
ncbi:ferrous iron transport protein A [bacterium]|nr:ferrous iron transport protein A [bacterium]